MKLTFLLECYKQDHDHLKEVDVPDDWMDDEEEPHEEGSIDRIIPSELSHRYSKGGRKRQPHNVPGINAPGTGGTMEQS